MSTASDRFPLRDSAGVVTGAASGIGRALALALSRAGCHLTLMDRDAAGLAETAEAARASGVTIATHAGDVTDSAAGEDLLAAALATHGRVNLLVNNAGVALAGDFLHVSAEQFDRVMAINFAAPVRLTRAFLPTLLREPVAQIVNLSSLFGLIAPAGQTAYSAAKFALRGFGEALRHELEGTSVGVTTIHPGGVATNIARSATVGDAVDPSTAERALRRMDKVLTLPPEQAAARILRGIERREKRVLVGRDAQIMDAAQRAAPVGYYRLLRKRLAQRPGARTST